MEIGAAVQAMRDGKKVAREGWNGKGMWLALKPGYPDGVAANAAMAKASGVAEGTIIKFRPYVMMRCADGSFVPWLASQSDLLGEDWSTVEG
jgi:hypothetical protein